MNIPNYSDGTYEKHPEDTVTGIIEKIHACADAVRRECPEVSGLSEEIFRLCNLVLEGKAAAKTKRYKIVNLRTGQEMKRGGKWVERGQGSLWRHLGYARVAINYHFKDDPDLPDIVLIDCDVMEGGILPGSDPKKNAPKGP